MTGVKAKKMRATPCLHLARRRRQQDDKGARKLYEMNAVPWQKRLGDICRKNVIGYMWY